MPKKLVLFDIDETITFSNGAGRRSVAYALGTLLGVSFDTVKVAMSGKTDPQIMLEMLAQSGYALEDGKARLEELIDLYLATLQEEIAVPNTYQLHDGAVTLIEELSHDQDACLGLLTGNVERGARLKLGPFDLNKYFPLGAFGSDAHDRMALPAIAHQRAEDYYSQTFGRRDIVIIGDAENDIRCAKGYGAVSIAVHTGNTTRQELERLEPDYLFASLKHTPEVMAAIFGENGKH